MTRQLRRLLARLFSGIPLVRRVPGEGRPRRVLGQDEGLFEVPEDFDAPLPEEAWADVPKAEGSPP